MLYREGLLSNRDVGFIAKMATPLRKEAEAAKARREHHTRRPLDRARLLRSF